MIKFTSGNMLRAKTDAIVNTVNTVGVMGKGIALQFKKVFPENYNAYKKACQRGEVHLGKMFIYRHEDLHDSRYIINFPTKGHWRTRSNIKDIIAGLDDLRDKIRELKIQTIALPPLGCGNGGLPWPEVRDHIVSRLSDLEDVEILVYEPKGAPSAPELIPQQLIPQMTAGRAAIIALISRYESLGNITTILEVQKLAYFLQAAGQDLRLCFVKEKYGPYADNLRHVLQIMEGHFISGYGDGTGNRNTELRLLGDAAQEAEIIISKNPQVGERFAEVESLVEGFESTYGMELLATLHWVTREDLEARTSPDAAVRAVHNWSARKKKAFRPEHIAVAWNRLHEHGWLN